MAILKHLTSKSSDYGAVLDYLMFQHDEKTGEELRDRNGSRIPREEFYLDGINCEPFVFDMECKQLNDHFHKNQNRGDVKSHHYIISFDPRDVTECGLDGKRVQAIGLEFANRFFAGHQMLVCTHMDGNNKSGNLADGIDYSAGEITVAELVDRYIDMKRNVKPNTMRAYGTAVKRIHEDEFGKKKIRSVRLSDAKKWFVKLHDSGMKRNTITVVQSVIRPAFEMAVDDDIIRKNPFKFNLSDLLPDDSFKRDALTDAQQKKYLQFIQEYGNNNYYDDIVILMETGLRVSELYGLTKSDIDLKSRKIFVRRQLCRTADQPYFICPPKTSSGIRTIPLSEAAYMAFRRVLANRPNPRVEVLIDGYSGFLFLDKDEKPKVAMHLENYMRGIQKKYRNIHAFDMPAVTPHVLRHTFCTNMQQSGIDVKSLQYLMGHSNVSVTLDIYTHSNYDSVERAFRAVVC